MERQMGTDSSIGKSCQKGSSSSACLLPSRRCAAGSATLPRSGSRASAREEAVVVSAHGGLTRCSQPSCCSWRPSQTWSRCGRGLAGERADLAMRRSAPSRRLPSGAFSLAADSLPRQSRVLQRSSGPKGRHSGLPRLDKKRHRRQRAEIRPPRTLTTSETRRRTSKTGLFYSMNHLGFLLV